MLIFLFAKTFEGPGVAVDVGMPTAAPPATPITPVSAVPIALVSVVPSVPVSVLLVAPILTGLGEFIFPYFLLHFFLVSFSSLDHSFSFHTLCFLDRFTSYCPLSV